MTLVLNEEQRQLADTAREFLRAQAPVTAFRRLRDSGDPRGYSADLWARMSELGWAGITIPEEYGGMDFGFAGIAALLQECGRSLAATPLFATCVLGASAIQLAGAQAQKEEMLPLVATGSLRLALALEESHHHAPDAVKLLARRVDGGYRLEGRKEFVLDGHAAERIVTLARIEGSSGRDGLCLFVVDSAAPGLERCRLSLVDSRNAARIDYAGVHVGQSALLGEEGSAGGVLDAILDRGRAAIAAEMLGGAEVCLDRTVAYLKQREQFGALIGSFQGLQHRAAQLFAELELLRSWVRAACDAVDATPEMLPMLASLAKASANDCAERITNEAVQMHGGIGTTDELDIGLFLKRARVCMQVLGDAAFHRDRYARLRGF
ncbi:MAG: acyl-CoA dehydrogenase family protein [Gammaproteobacteria bacterium]